MENKYKIQVNSEYQFEFSESDIRTLDAQQKATNQIHIIDQNRSTNVQIVESDFLNRAYSIKINSNLYNIKIETPLDVLIDSMGLAKGVITAINNIFAPMPGLILSVSVNPSDTVKEGDFLLVLEAMKMENALTAPRDGVVKAVSVKKGDTVDKGQLLIEME